MRRRGFLSLAAPVAGLGALPTGAARAAVDNWRPLSDVQLTASKAGNALDFSFLGSTDAAGRSGWAQAVPGGIGFEREPKARRFLCASMVFSPPNGGLPGHDDARRLAQELRRAGYNAVRLHFIDAHLMEGRNKDFDFDPVRVERLQFLMAQLKTAGLYWIVDGMTSDNGAYGDVGPNRYAFKHRAKLDALITDEGFDHWRQLVDGIWGVVNPHTGLAPLADAALLGVILINEGGIGFRATAGGGRYPPALAAPFRRWLNKRYGGDSTLRGAWSGDVKPDESLDGDIGVPQTLRGSGPRDKDFARFVSDLESDGQKRMEAHLRQRGFGGLCTAYDNWGFFGADVTRSRSAWVDMHCYHTEPTKYVEPGSRILQTSVLDGMGRAVRELSNARQWDKPFTVSEYGQPFWNRYRYEMSALVPAMAAHHGWSLICQFAEVPLQFDYGPSPFARRQAIYPYGVGADPITHAGERLAALLFLRGDVAPSSHRIRFHLRPDAVFSRRGGWEQVPEGLSRLAFVAPVGLDFGPLPAKPVPGELSVDLMESSPSWVSQLQNAMTRSGIDTGTDLTTPLRKAGIVHTANRTLPGQQRYESDTHQLLIDGRERVIAIDTPRTAVLVLNAVSGSVGRMTVEEVSGPALFAASAIDGRNLADSRRILVWVLTDAINSGMTFADPERTTLTKLGTFPPQVRTVSFKLSLNVDTASALKGWALSLNGNRRQSVTVRTQAGQIYLALDTALLASGPALFFELATE